MHPSDLLPMGPPALARYGSAPGSLLASLANSVISGAADGEFTTVGSRSMTMSRFFSGDSSPCLTSESTCRTTVTSPDLEPTNRSKPVGLQRSYGLSEIQGGSNLVRHSSSPAGFFSHLMVDPGSSATNGIVSYSQAGIDGFYPMENTRLSSQRSFSQRDSLSQISEIINMPDIGESVTGSTSVDTSRIVKQSYLSSTAPIGSWENTNSIVFSSKRAKDNNGDIIRSLSNIDSQFNLPSSLLEIDTLENFLEIQQESTSCKVRAKRGCATHPRSIAERERRTRISKKLRKLQQLVPNMDKQTNTSDMLELAVQHIKELQSQIQTLNEEQADCTCTIKQERV